MSDREVDVQPLLEHSFGGQRATRELIDAIDLVCDQDQTVWLTLGEGGKRVARLMPADETTADERALAPSRRGRCRYCGKTYGLTQRGRVRRHNIKGSQSVCGGSGNVPS